VFLLLLVTNTLLAAEVQFYVGDKKAFKSLGYVLKGDHLKVHVKSKNTKVYAQGQIGDKKYKAEYKSEITMETTVGGVDKLRGYITVAVFFSKEQSGGTQDSFFANIPVTTPSEIKAEAALTDEQKAKEYKDSDSKPSNGSVTRSR
jgi:hypothetical protein